MSATALKGALEENVLTLLCHSEQHASALAIELRAELFSSRPYRLIAETALDYLRKFRTPPRAHLRDLLEDKLRKGEEGQLLGRILDAMDVLLPDLQPDFVLSQLSTFIETRKLANALSDAADALQQGELDKARQAIYRNDLAPRPSPGIWLSDPDAMLEFLEPREDDLFSSGIDELDRRNVRPARGELFVYLGSKGVGKSWWAIQMAKQNVMQRRSVLHLSFENSQRLTAQRYVQAFFAMTTEEASSIRVPMFKKDSLGRFVGIEFDTRTPDQLSLRARAALSQRLLSLRNRAPLYIKAFPTGSMSVEQVDMYLDSLERIESFRPDLLILDQAFNLRFDQRDVRTSMGQALIQLRGLAVRRDMAIATPWQGNRLTDSARTVTAAHTAEDWSLGGTADTFCTISRTSKEREIGLARILVDKARSARDKFVVMITQNFDTGQFALDSVYMSRFVEEEANRLFGEDGDGD